MAAINGRPRPSVCLLSLCRVSRRRITHARSKSNCEPPCMPPLLHARGWTESGSCGLFFPSLQWGVLNGGGGGVRVVYLIQWDPLAPAVFIREEAKRA